MNPPWALSPISVLLNAGDAGDFTAPLTLDGGTCSAEIELANAVSAAYFDLTFRGIFEISRPGCELVDNSGSSIMCDVNLLHDYAANSTTIRVTTQGSNTIGGSGNSWHVEGAFDVDGTHYAIYISSPVPHIEIISISRALPIASGNSFSVNLNSGVSPADCVSHLSVKGEGVTFDLTLDASSATLPYLCKLSGGPALNWGVVDNVISFSWITSYLPAITLIEWV